MSWSKAVLSAGDDRAVLLADAGERIPHEMDAATLDSRSKHLGGSVFQTLVVIGDIQAGAAAGIKLEYQADFNLNLQC